VGRIAVHRVFADYFILRWIISFTSAGDCGLVFVLAAKPMIDPLSLPGIPVSAHSAECIDGSTVSQRGGARAYFKNQRGNPRKLGDVWGKTKLGTPHIKFTDAAGCECSLAEDIIGRDILVHIHIIKRNSISLTRAQAEALSNHLLALLKNGTLDL
jgi:hypothetical protein